ncbi:MAG: HNH endonuclease [Rhodobacteraceae bacterium]|nr:HNH endonuclease [Paracoccaceae bacterium]MCY4197086.1 HNH endonuclease [Paracoccaceae bacterium]
MTKGPSPRKDAYPHYRDALDDLTDRLGSFCSYCEQQIQHRPEIEHVQPKSLEPGLERCWENLLLGCATCNQVKSNKSVNLDQVALPDRDNTFRGLSFHKDGRLEVSDDLTDPQAKLMKRVVRLVRLDRHPDCKNKDDRPTPRDKRAELRRDVWDIATEALNTFEKIGLQPTNSGRIACLIVNLAVAKGFFSVWMTVFRDHPDMLNRFIQAFPGTDAGSFNNVGQPVSRAGGRF